MSKRSFSEMQDDEFDDDLSSKRCASQMSGKAILVKENSYRVQIRKAFNLLKETFQPKSSIDFCCPLQLGWKVFDDYDCALLAGDESPQCYYRGRKEYVFQILIKSTPYIQYFVWGRSNSSTGLNGVLRGPFFNSVAAINVFEHMFEDKTGNEWTKRNQFHHKPGKCHLWTEYHLWGQRDVIHFLRFIPFDSFAPSVLDCELRQLMGLITGDFTFELQRMNLDLKKMPTTHLNSAQIEEGYKILDAIETAIRTNSTVSYLRYLTKYFYLVIPHTAKRTQTTLKDVSHVQEKKNLLKVLEDIELMTRLQRKRLQEIPWIHLLRNFEYVNPFKPMFPSVTDLQYELLNCKLTHVDSLHDNYELIHNYIKNTGRLGIEHIWEVLREDEEKIYAEHDGLANRKLLWHGTHTASVASILRSGLLINCHVNGKFGKGLYFASQNAKAANYVSYNEGGHGLMFLCEVALGKEYHTTEEDHSLLAPPDGFQSVIGRGVREPDPAKDVTIILDGREVVVPQGSPRVMEDYRQSRFSQSDYVVYQENQVRIRYLVQVTYRHQRLE